MKQLYKICIACALPLVMIGCKKNDDSPKHKNPAKPIPLRRLILGWLAICKLMR